jgi:hypothetical protein
LFARAEGVGDQQIRLIWDCVALKSTPSVALHKEREVVLCTVGI